MSKHDVQFAALSKIQLRFFLKILIAQVQPPKYFQPEGFPTVAIIDGLGAEAVISIVQTQF
jgi:hypothetical protein